MILKSKLVKEKGGFGQKIYDYIYGLMIKERYSLLNKVVLGQITQGAADNLKSQAYEGYIRESKLWALYGN